MIVVAILIAAAMQMIGIGLVVVERSPASTIVVTNGTTFVTTVSST